MASQFAHTNNVSVHTMHDTITQERAHPYSLTETGSLKGTEGKMWDVSGLRTDDTTLDAMSEIALLMQLRNNIKVLHVCCS